MHSNCVLDFVASLLFRHMVFVGNVKKSPIAVPDHCLYFYFSSQGLGSFSRFLLSNSALTGLKEGG